jgi:hypothetical protein
MVYENKSNIFNLSTDISRPYMQSTRSPLRFRKSQSIQRNFFSRNWVGHLDCSDSNSRLFFCSHGGGWQNQMSNV